MEVHITRIDKTLPLPAYHSDGAAAFDLYSRVDMTIRPGEIALIPANVIIATPPGHALIVALRSSTPRRKSLIVPHGFGLIDPDYRGPQDEVMVQVYSIAKEPVRVERGERIAQAFIIPAPKVSWQETAEADAPTRGGLGSTGA